ncbi:hypothetical protein BRADI_3g45755v3 [Brachypodium distachyon]|uniref:Uncharacterized protein n=1 Tax=Brachypodium distachyon TaxID=15368 RepID=A0A0Q3I1Z7_BRADI|nr:hypothetical protein BRADI_3g45755v3 [Brachypodium distachyon]
MENDFTFPTAQQDLGEPPLFPAGRLQVCTASSPLWPFSSSPPPAFLPATTTADVQEEEEEEEAPSLAPTTRRAHHEEDRMDLLWEDLNDSPGAEPTTMMMLRGASSRAGRFCASRLDRRRGRRATGWTLLLRLFRRLFAPDRRQDAVLVPPPHAAQ